MKSNGPIWDLVAHISLVSSIGPQVSSWLGQCIFTGGHSRSFGSSRSRSKSRRRRDLVSCLVPSTVNNQPGIFFLSIHCRGWRISQEKTGGFFRRRGYLLCSSKGRTVFNNTPTGSEEMTFVHTYNTLSGSEKSSCLFGFSLENCNKRIRNPSKSNRCRSTQWTCG